jgi:histidinol-phosphate/aromatic aminotransferase/cobyric acid decarboxylase-like protein
LATSRWIWAFKRNQWGAPRLRAVRLPAQEPSRYLPGAYEPSLAAASDAGVSADAIACGCGSDDVLDSTIALSANGVTCWPAQPFVHLVRICGPMDWFVAIPLTTALRRCRRHGGDGRSLIYLTPEQSDRRRALAPDCRRSSSAPGLVIIDQAYVEFGGNDTVDLFNGRTIVTRCAKAFGGGL